MLLLSACTSTVAHPLAALPLENVIGAALPAVAATPQPRVAPQARVPQMTFPFAVQPEWAPTQVNYDEGRDDGRVDYIVIHYTAISYARTLRAFHNPNSGVSAHYVIRGSDGHVAQLVGEADTAWHAGNTYFNDHSVGIEIEKSGESNPDFTPIEYLSAAALACQIAARHDIPLDRAHVIGHNEVPWPNDHSDPGPTWDWPYFMWLTSLCAPATARTVHASFVSETAYPDVPVGNPATVTVVLRNTGATAWRRGTSQEARLAIPGNDPKYAYLGVDWLLPTRPAVQQEEIVPPGGTGTFTFTVSAEISGRYVIPLRGVIDGGAWMDDLGIFTVVNAR